MQSEISISDFKNKIKMYKYILQPILFQFDAEKAHYITFNLIKFLFKIPFVPQIFKAIYHFEHPSLEREVFGLKFKNPVGLAAGFDKNAQKHKRATINPDFLD
jgi:dihydroorotate dehydrogenase